MKRGLRARGRQVNAQTPVNYYVNKLFGGKIFDFFLIEKLAQILENYIVGTSDYREIL